MSDAINIPLQELKLPKTGYVVKIMEYLTTGQSRELQKIMLSEGTLDIEKGKMQQMPVKTFLEMQDRAAELLIKEVINKEGKSQPFTIEWLYDLPIEDGNFVYDKINEITSASQLTDDKRKKS